MNIEIKLLKNLDKSYLSKVATSYVAAYNKAKVLGEHWTNEQAEKYFDFSLKRQNDLFFVALIEGQVAGGILGEIRRLSFEYLFVADLFVDPNFQGKGIAKALFKKLLEVTRENYPESKMVDTLADSTKPFPIGWYDKLGMHPTGWTHISGDLKEMQEKM